MSDPLNHLGSIWYQSEPSDVPYSPNQYLALDFFAASYSKIALAYTGSVLRVYCSNIYAVTCGLFCMQHNIIYEEALFLKSRSEKKKFLTTHDK